MFLHSGAGLHGHEYSNRPSSTSGHTTQRRNTLLRSSFATPITRASTYSSADSRSPPPTVTRPVAARNSYLRQSLPAHSPNTPEPVVRFKEPEHEAVVSPSLHNRSESMSEDGGSVDISDSDASHAASSTRRARKRATRKTTTYFLAQPPPKLGIKQRIIHLRPQLLLQLQLLSDGHRPQPAIDVYPSSVLANLAVAAPLLKRFPRLARIKRELSIHDVMLVKSENYNAPSLSSDSDGSEENINKRELVAILSPLMTEDKAEIVLTDGTVWLATPRLNSSGEFCSYEFTTVDDNGHAITARWVRRQAVTKSLPCTPTSTVPAMPRSSSPQSLDYKFTFSVIDPACRRHPIMATLTPASLEIQDTYTTVSQSSGRYPPISPPLVSSGQSPNTRRRHDRVTRTVEEWQKVFIQVSAMWVAIRHGWASNFKPSKFVPSSAVIAQTDSALYRSNFSYSSEAASLKLAEPANRRRCPSAFREIEQPVPGALPRRATSTGAAFIQRRKTQLKALSESDCNELEGVDRRSARSLSHDWHGSMANSSRRSSIMSDRKRSSLNSHDGTMPTEGASGGKRMVSGYFPEVVYVAPNPMMPIISSEESHPVSPGEYLHSNLLFQPMVAMDAEAVDGRGRQNKWKTVSSWFNKLRAH